MQVVEAVLFVVSQFPQTYGTCLLSFAQGSTRGEHCQEQVSLRKVHRDLPWIHEVCGRLQADRHHFEDTKHESCDSLTRMSDIRHALEHKHGLLAPMERAAKAALEVELLLHALKVSIPHGCTLSAVTVHAVASHHGAGNKGMRE
jgi:hypothetical protein